MGAEGGVRGGGGGVWDPPLSGSIGIYRDIILYIGRGICMQEMVGGGWLLPYHTIQKNSQNVLTRGNIFFRSFTGEGRGVL